MFGNQHKEAIMKKKLIDLHQTIFNQKPKDVYFSPGRINLIGEHTDYAGGYVLPMALSMGLYASVSVRYENIIAVYSDDFKEEGIKEIDINNLEAPKEKGYLAYIQGMIYKLMRERCPCSNGLNITIKGDLPKASGLSSSAALLVLIGYIITDQFGFDLAPDKLARYARFVENNYLGLHSGIMDPFVIVHGKKDHAIFLNTERMDYQHVPFKLIDHTLVMMNTNKPRTLVDSDYNDRVDTIRQATRFFQDYRPIDALCDLTIEDFNKLKPRLSDATMIQRIEHVLFENDRTKQAKDILLDSDYEMFGDFMVQSHESLRYLYEVSCPELDYLVSENMRLGALGARMTGAGFGGTMIALYPNDKLPKDFQAMKDGYYKTFKRVLEVYTATASDGVKKI